jgi:hypothetical protein
VATFAALQHVVVDMDDEHWSLTRAAATQMRQLGMHAKTKYLRRGGACVVGFVFVFQSKMIESPFVNSVRCYTP